MSLAVINSRALLGMSAPRVTVEVHLADGEQFWLWVAAGSFEEVADRLIRKRNLIGRFVGCARDEHDARRMIVPAEHIKLIVDIDG